MQAAVLTSSTRSTDCNLNNNYAGSPLALVRGDLDIKALVGTNARKRASRYLSREFPALAFFIVRGRLDVIRKTDICAGGEDCV